MQIKSQHSNTKQVKSTGEIQEIMQDILCRVRARGADAAIHVNYDRGLSVDVRMREVEAVEFSEDKDIQLTLYIGKRKGIASSTDHSSESIENMVNAAYDIAKISTEDPCFGLADEALTVYPDLDLLHPWDIEPDGAIQLALDCEAEALLQANISNSDGVSVATGTSAYGYADTFGRQGVVHSSNHSLSCSLIAKKGERMQRDHDYTVARHQADLMDAKQLALSAAKRASARLGARKITTQKAPVVFSSRVSSGILGAFIAAVSGSNLYLRQSFLQDSIGMQLFPDFVEIYEQPHLLRGLGSAPFDNEGVLTRNNHIVQSGCLQQYVLGSYSARKLGLKTTANSGGVFNLTMPATSQGGLSTILKQMGTGFLVTELMGQGVNGLTGDYSRGASGFWVENGEIQYPVEEVTVAGNLKQMFKNIVTIGDDTNPGIATRCGSILIEQMMIAGS